MAVRSVQMRRTCASVPIACDLRVVAICARARARAPHTDAMISAPSQLVTMPLVTRFAVVGATTTGTLGALLGLILGLLAHPVTAWFAVFEVGVPAAIAGGVVGALVGLFAVIVRRVIHR
jgi:hypothetical protein